MYFLREKSEDPVFLQLPHSSPNPKDPQLFFFPEKSVASWFFRDGIAERSLINWITDTFIDPTKVFVDIGAHVGTYTWICGKRAKHTYSFECSPKTFCYLAANVALHELTEKVTVFPFALGKEAGQLPYYIRSEDGGGNGIKQLVEKDVASFTVPVQPLDFFNLENVGFLKIDVEGAELEVLQGARQTLERNGWPTILFECWGEWKEREGVPALTLRKEVFSYLESLGYRLHSISGYPDMWLADHT